MELRLSPIGSHEKVLSRRLNNDHPLPVWTADCRKAGLLLPWEILPSCLPFSSKLSPRSSRPMKMRLFPLWALTCVSNHNWAFSLFRTEKGQVLAQQPGWGPSPEQTSIERPGRQMRTQSGLSIISWKAQVLALNQAAVFECLSLAQPTNLNWTHPWMGDPTTLWHCMRQRSNWDWRPEQFSTQYKLPVCLEVSPELQYQDGCGMTWVVPTDSCNLN